MNAGEPVTSGRMANLEWLGVGWLVVLYHDFAHLLEPIAAADLRNSLELVGLLKPDGENLTERGEEARRDALRLLVERQIAAVHIENLTADDVARWAALADAATPGPWHQGDTDQHEYGNADEVYKADGQWLVGPMQEEHDARFIAAARTAVPALCAEVARLRAALVAAGAWLALPEAIRDHVTADMRCAAPLQSASDRPTTDAWEAGIRCLEAGRPLVTALELAERARLRAADQQRALVQQIAKHAPTAHSNVVAAVEAQNPDGLTAEQREQVGYVAALVQASAYTCITGRPDDAALAFAALLGAAGESDDGRRGAARALRHIAAVLEGRAVPTTTAEQDADALRGEAERAEEAAEENDGALPRLSSGLAGRGRGIRRALDVLAPHLPPPRGAR